MKQRPGISRIEEIVHLVQTRTMPENYDRDYVVPAADVTEYITSLLRRAASCVSDTFPAGEVFPDGWGGMTVEWQSGNQMVRLVVPPFYCGIPLLVYRVGKRELRDENVTTETLVRLLNALQTVSVPERVYRTSFVPAELIRA